MLSVCWMNTQRYATDLTDEQWAVLDPLLPPPQHRGRPRADLREVLNGILYLNRTGCQWRLLPHEFPPWGTRSTITTAGGASTEPGRGSTTLCASKLEAKKRGVKLPRVRPSWIPKA